MATARSVSYTHLDVYKRQTLTYLVDADNPDDDMEPFQPGDKSPMNESFLEDSRYIYETGSRSDNYFYSHSDFGYNTSAIVPVENSAGEIVAIIGVELAMKTLEAARTEYVIYVILLGALLTAIVITAFLVYLRRAVIRPIPVSYTHLKQRVKEENMDYEKMMEKAKEAKSAEELLALAKENDIEMTEEEAEETFAMPVSYTHLDVYKRQA